MERLRVVVVKIIKITMQNLKKKKDWKEKKIMYAAEVVTTVISISPLPHLDDKHANTTTNIDHAFTCADQA